MRADLHLHTTASDGLLTPARMVREARLAGMNIIAITDHDTVSGVREALDAGVREGVRVLPGLELSVGGEEEIHLLAYGVRPEHPGLLALLEGLLVRRQARMEEMLRRLEALGMPVPREEACAPDSPFMGRMNLARAMTARGYCASPAEAFSRWLNAGRPAYVPKEPIGVPEGVRRLRALGAVVCLAHPGRLRMEESALLARLPAGAVIIDLASAPGGVDLAAADALGLCARFAPGLPGRCAPATAGALVADTVLRMLCEQTEGEG